MKTSSFEDALIESINDISGPTGEVKDALKVLGRLILKTKITEKHTKILQAFKKIAKPLGTEIIGGLLFQVSEKLKQEEALLRPKKPRAS